MLAPLISPFDIATRFDNLPLPAVTFLVDVFLALERESFSVTEETEEQLLERGMQIIEAVANQSAFGTQLLGFIGSSERRYSRYINLATPRQLNKKLPVRRSLAA